MSESRSEAYAKAGVDVTAGYESVRLMKRHVESTFIPGVLGGLGGFGGMFKPDLSGMDAPVFVSGTDGVGTKLKMAFRIGKHDTIGIDCVAMCVNDIICAGAKPLFFLDYIAQGKVVPERVERIVAGIAEGCRQSGCALVGGETAEMPGFYPEDEYDIAGFAVGVVDEKDMLVPKNVAPGDVVIGLPSSGVHSNGFSLIRKIFDSNEYSYDRFYPELGCTLGEELLKPTQIYVPVLNVPSVKKHVKSMAHITGGGFYENLPRMIPEGISLKIDKNDIDRPAIFDIIMRTGEVSERDMYNTFNMGIGLAMTLPSDFAAGVVSDLLDAGFMPRIIGECVATPDGTNDRSVEIV